MAETHYIPQGFHTLTPYLIVKDAAGAIDFYKQALGAVERSRMADPSGKVRHAEIRVGDSPIMITDENPEYPEWKGPLSRGGTPVHLYLYVENVDAVFAQAIESGAKELLPLQDRFYGDRSGAITDPYGHVWYISTHVEDVSPEEMERRMAEQGKAD